MLPLKKRKTKPRWGEGEGKSSSFEKLMQVILGATVVGVRCFVFSQVTPWHLFKWFTEKNERPRAGGVGWAGWWFFREGFGSASVRSGHNLSVSVPGLLLLREERGKCMGVSRVSGGVPG